RNTEPAAALLVNPSQECSMKRQSRVFSFVASICCICGCTDSPSGPYARALEPAGKASLSAVKLWEANAAANWTDEATSLAARRNVNVARVFTYLSLAQLRAA